MSEYNSTDLLYELQKTLKVIISKRCFMGFRFIKTIGLTLFAIVLFNSCGSLKNSDYSAGEKRYSNDALPSEPGKCYAKLLVQDRYETFEEELLIYTGDNVDIEGVSLETVIFKPASTKWEKVKDTNCRSRNPKDCFIWCLKEDPEVSNDYYLVIDTNIVSDYKVEVVSYRDLVEEGGFKEWQEVVCEADVTEGFYRKIQMALIAEGFGGDINPDGPISNQTKEALVKYQKSNGLPIGSLNIETLEHLGIEY